MDHKLIRAIGSVTCVMLLVKVLAMIKNILQARVYGAGGGSGCVHLGQQLFDSLFTTMSYALCITAIPILTQNCSRERDLLPNGQCLDCQTPWCSPWGHRGVVLSARGDY